MSRTKFNLIKNNKSRIHKQNQYPPLPTSATLRKYIGSNVANTKTNKYSNKSAHSYFPSYSNPPSLSSCPGCLSALTVHLAIPAIS